MGRKRLHDEGLPPRVYPHHGGYIYRPKNAKAVMVGTTPMEAWEQYGRLIKQGVAVRPPAKAGTFAVLIEHFRKNRYQELAKATQDSYDPWLNRIEVALGDVSPAKLTPKDIYAFIDGVTQSASTSNIIIAIFRNLYKIAVKKGLCDSNVARDVEKEGKSRRTRVPEFTELEAFKQAQYKVDRRVDGDFWSCYIDLKLLTGLRQKDLIELPPINPKVGTLRVEMSKSKRWDKQKKRRIGRPITIEVTEDVRVVLQRLYALPRPQNKDYLLCNTRGGKFSSNAFQRTWYRAMLRYMKTIGPEEHELAAASDHWFHEHDIRATIASVDPANAQERLGHKDAQTTAIYLRDLKSAAEANPMKPLSMKLLQSFAEAPKTGNNIHQLPERKSK